MEKIKKFSIKDYYLSSNASFKKFILVLLLFLFIILCKILGPSVYGILIFIYVIIFILVFPETQINFSRILLIVAWVFIIGVLLVWFSGLDVPISRDLDNQSMLVLFTAILAITTLISANIYRKISGFSRLSEVDFYLEKTLCLIIKNKGNYPIRNLKVLTQILRSGKKKIKEVWFELFQSPNEDYHYIPSGNEKIMDLRGHLEKRFNVTFDHDIQQYTALKKTSFRIKVTANFSSDTLFRNPTPIIKEFKINISPEGTEIREVKPTI